VHITEVEEAWVVVCHLVDMLRFWRRNLTDDPSGETPVRKYWFGAAAESEEDTWDKNEAEWLTLATGNYNKYELGQRYGRDPHKDWFVAKIEPEAGSVATGFIYLARLMVKWDRDETRWVEKTTNHRGHYQVGQLAPTKSRDCKPWVGGWYVAKIDDKPTGDCPDAGILHLSPPAGTTCHSPLGKIPPPTLFRLDL
jgi:hypothetical protein